MVLPNHRGLPVCFFGVKIAALGSLKRVTERVSKLVRNFKGERSNFLSLIFSSRRKTKNCKTTQSLYMELKNDNTNGVFVLDVYINACLQCT
jgi:hypothetical protein